MTKEESEQKITAEEQVPPNDNSDIQNLVVEPAQDECYSDTSTVSLDAHK